METTTAAAAPATNKAPLTTSKRANAAFKLMTSCFHLSVQQQSSTVARRAGWSEEVPLDEKAERAVRNVQNV